MILDTRPFGTAEYIDTQSKWFSFDHQYLDYLKHIYHHGVDKMDRTGTGARSIFGYMMRFDLQRGIPLLTTKRVPQKTVFDELKWFLEGSTNNERLREINQMHSKMDWSERDTIWSEWAGPNGELGPVYSEQWRNFPGPAQSMYRDSDEARRVFKKMEADPSRVQIVRESESEIVVCERFDQIQEIVDLLMREPDSRRMLCVAWNPAQRHLMALPPCHVLFQFYTRPATYEERRREYDKRYSHVGADNDINHEYFDDLHIPRRILCCLMFQRSVDSFLGLPFNIVSYSMLNKMMAQQVNMIAGDFVWFGGDCHIYSNHFPQVLEQLSRSPNQGKYAFPQMEFLRKPESIFDYDWKDIEISNYDPQSAIEAAVAV